MKNDDSKMILDVKEETFDKKEEVKKDSLSKHFKQTTDELYKKFGIRLTKKELAPKLDMSYEQFRKIINREQPTKKRDCIIAISAVLGCDTDDTNKALKYNDYMQELDEDSSRDLLIMNILDNHRRRYEDGRDELDYNPDIIDEINNELAANHYPLLDIISHRNTGKEEAEKLKYPYKLVRKTTTNYMHKSVDFLLDSKYLNPCSVHASMEFDDNGRQIVISASSSKLAIDLEEHCFERREGTDNFKEIQFYSDIDETGEYKDCFLELIRIADEELKKSDNVYNDTKNFTKRISARVIDGNIHVFAEMYNFAYPLLDEYYFMDYCNGEYTFALLNNSRFMKFYLPNEIYQKKYGYTKDKIIAEFSFDEEGYFTSEGKSETEDKNGVSVIGPLQDHIDKLRARYFKKLKKKIGKLITELKSGKEHIHALVPFKDNRYDVIEFFKAEKEFECVWETSEYDYGKKHKDEFWKNINAAPDVDSDFDFEAAYEKVKSKAKENKSGISESVDFKDYYSLLYAFYKLKMKQGKTIEEIDASEARISEYKKKIVEVGNPEPTFTLSDGREVKLSVQDLIDGYKLGICTIEELGAFKLKHNSLKIEDLL